MSYEVYRNEVYCAAMNYFDKGSLEKFMQFMDKVSEKFTVTKKCTDLICADGVPEDLIKAYIASKAVANRSKGTIKEYFSIIQWFFRMIHVPIDQITSTTIRVYLNDLQRVRNNSPATADHKRIVLNDFFQFCVEENVLKVNPCRHVDPIKFQEHEREPLTSIELESMRFVCKDLREKALVEFLFSTGCRIAEVADMKLSDVDFENKTVIIQHGKGDKRRKSYLNAKAIVALREYLKTRTDSCESLFVDKRSNGKHGVQRAALRMEVRRIAVRAGIQHRVTPHNFRHTTSTELSASGMPIEQIQQLLGHASIRTTRRYVKVADEDVKTNHWKYM